MSQTPREYCQKRWASLKQERSTWEPQWKDIADQMIPYRQRWQVTDANKGARLNDKIYNSTPVIALRRLASGMMSGITSPSKKWWQLVPGQKDLLETDEVRNWFAEVEDLLSQEFAQSNFYSVLASGLYLDLGAIGTAAMLAEEDPDGLRVLRYQALPIAEYCLDVDAWGEVDTIYREIPFTAKQLVGKFGRDKCSQMVKMAWDNGDYSKPFKVVQAVFPVADLPNEPAGKFKYFSWWFEATGDEQTFLRQGGYYEFPAFCPRWMVRAGDTYGRGPGWDARGDCRALQHLEVRLATLVDKITNPPMVASEGLRASRVTLLPGDVTYVPRGQAEQLAPAQVVQPQALNAMLEHVQRHEMRVKEALYSDLWLWLLTDERNQRATATEIEESKQQMLLQLGPVLENLNNGLLEPAVLRLFYAMSRAGRLPPMPEALMEMRPDGSRQGKEFRVEFISIMHQMQHAMGLSGLRTLIGVAREIADAGNPSVLDKLDGDKCLDEVALMTAVNPKVLRPDDELAKIRKGRERAAAAQQQGEGLMGLAQGMKDLGATNVENLRGVASMMSPAAAAQGMAGSGQPMGGVL